MTDASCEQKFPVVITKEVILKKTTTASGNSLKVIDNPLMFKDFKVTTGKIINRRPAVMH